MKNKDSLGDRMKGFECITRNYLIPRIPAIIRLDGKAFHTFTKGMQKPFDLVLQETMQHTMKVLCESIQGAAFGYTQSDEITIVLYAPNPESGIWFDGNIQKITSVSASLATLHFNKIFKEMDKEKKYEKKYDVALFDSRVFNIPFEEVHNCVLWRQQDATKNAIQMVAQNVFSHKSLQGLNGSQLQEKLFSEKGINFNDFPTVSKRGTACRKLPVEITTENGTTIRNKWLLDLEMPILTEHTEYIKNILAK
jgi:tRNA(His) guanylyltransferase